MVKLLFAVIIGAMSAFLAVETGSSFKVRREVVCLLSVDSLGTTKVSKNWDTRQGVNAKMCVVVQQKA